MMPCVCICIVLLFYICSQTAITRLSSGIVSVAEASRAITVKAVKSYSNVNDPQSLTFAAGDLITVILRIPG